MRRFGSYKVAESFLKDYLQNIRKLANYNAKFHLICKLFGYFDVGPVDTGIIKIVDKKKAIKE